MKHLRPKIWTHNKGMIIKKNNMPQISQILADLKLPKVVSSLLILGEKFLRNLRNLWQKNIEFKQFNIRHI